MVETKFMEIKQKIKEITKTNKNEVTSDTHFVFSGIYLLYVNDFSDNKIIPFYIGQTTNFQRRYKNHLDDILNLYTCSYADYHNAFLWGALGKRCRYDGKYRPNKIFKYMVEHECSLSDIHMIILEECDKSDLRKIEQQYLTEYLPAFFGFNQINTITERWISKEDPEEYKNLAERDAEYFLQYLGYGFTAFNYLHAFANSPYNKHKLLLDEKINLLIGNDMWRTPSESFTMCCELLDKYEIAYEKAKKEMSEIFSVAIHNIFEKCKLKSKGREDEVLSLLVNHYDTEIVNDVAEIKEYLKYYMSRNRNSRECGDLLNQLFNKHHEKITEISTPVMNFFEAYIECRKTSLMNSRFYLIFPNVETFSHQ